ncbi:hypothetical protein [Streptomyces sp. cmx-18-6]|uniref:hypothetical protein n=1 Tax=Streptomyces sp. cmx-18-6 TaxID=2790930 RepID=UPI00398067C5
MASLIADHPPQTLAYELTGLLDVDWPTVWAGTPADDTERGRWCEGFGWEPLWFASGLWVRTRRNGRLHLTSASPGRPVTAVSYTAWRARADQAAENPALMAAAVDRYAAHLAAVTEVLGPPDWHGAWDAPDFPAPHTPADRGDADRRLEHRTPHRFARWSFRTPAAPVFELSADLAPGTAPGWGPGSATISLTCHGPADPQGRTGPGWLL